MAERGRPHPRSAEAQQYRQWYGTARWQKLRWSILVRDSFTCQECRRIEHDTSKLHCDHVDKDSKATRFFDGPFRTLCSHCHNAHKQAEERGGYKRGSDADGRPVDVNHPWNR